MTLRASTKETCFMYPASFVRIRTLSGCIIDFFFVPGGTPGLLFFVRGELYF